MIITEKEKSMVVFSSLFDRHYPVLYKQLSNIMSNHHIGHGHVCHTKDYWVRDFMPVQVDENVFVKFTFDPNYLQDKKKYITNVDKVINNCPFVKDFVFVNISLKLEGGNMVLCKGCKGIKESTFVVMTEKVLAENPKLCKEQIELIFRNAFQEPNLIIVWLPWDRKDIFGHTDGIVKYIGYNKNGKPQVLVNLELYDKEIAEQMYDTLNHYFEVIELKLSEYDELSWAYINCLQTKDFIIIPGISNVVTDAEALNQYRELFPEHKETVYQVQMREFIAEYGGALNCLTWTFYENFYKALLTDEYVERKNFNGHKRLPVQKNLDEFMNDYFLKSNFKFKIKIK